MNSITIPFSIFYCEFCCDLFCEPYIITSDLGRAFKVILKRANLRANDKNYHERIACVSCGIEIFKRLSFENGKKMGKDKYKKVWAHIIAGEKMEKMENILTEFGLTSDDVSPTRTSRIMDVLKEIEGTRPEKGVLTLYRDSATSKVALEKAVSHLEKMGYNTAVIKNYSRVKGKLANVPVFHASAGNPARTMAILFIRK